ncbi:hypothetical protein JCGZ_17433 [Jatropha curcas]|uniref:DUF1308 domain-containing protein n=1 Tax=Jatropha curcas TaxID=180498 RepID=A0A067LBH5_JATCU|nr:uncharacterized protein LOC105640023 [Jatropha curcas]KDP45826.1 hypothetical protein JCGZ_17433 [Jatropha curcas]
MEEIEAARNRCQRVIENVQRLPRRTTISDSCCRTLLKLAFSELHFLSRFHPPPSLPLSVNIGHLEAVVHLLEQPFVTAVSRVCKPIPIKTNTKNVHVDIVCIVNKNPVWIIVSDRNPVYLSWNGCIKSRIERILATARSSKIMKPSSILLFFSRGLPDFVFEKIKNEFGAFQVRLEFDFHCEELEGDWINVLQRPYQDSIFLEIKVEDRSIRESVVDADSVDSVGPVVEEGDAKSNLEDNSTFCCLISGMKSDGDVINFDTTALIALVSGISNGCTDKLLATPEIQLRQRFKGNFEFVIAQVLSEIKNPIHAELAGVICGKKGIICESVLAEFKELILLCGGPKEKLRADKILKHLMFVPDSPSERMMCLPTTRKLALKNKVVFGTGDNWHAPTLTANTAFLRAVSQTGMSLLTIEHRPRALTGD